MSSKNDHWAEQKESGSYLGMLILLWAYRLGGRWLFSLILYPVIVYFFVVSGKARRASHDFLSNAYQTGSPALQSKPRAWHSFRHFLSFGYAILDKFSVWLGSIDNEPVEFPNRDFFRAKIAESKGGLILASHLGNLEICRYLSNQTPSLRLNILVHTEHAQRFNELLKKVNTKTNITFIQVNSVGPDTAMLLKQKVDDGEFIAIVGDRIPVVDNMRVATLPFLGTDATFPLGPFILAALMKCPVYTLFCVKREDHYQIDIDCFSEQLILQRKTRDVDLQRYLEKYVDILQHYALQYPYQWFNFYNFWQTNAPNRDQ